MIRKISLQPVDAQLKYPLRYDYKCRARIPRIGDIEADITEMIGSLKLQGEWTYRFKRASSNGYLEYYFYFENKADQMLVRLSVKDARPVHPKMKMP
jgi:hypothetical protein